MWWQKSNWLNKIEIEAFVPLVLRKKHNQPIRIAICVIDNADNNIVIRIFGNKTLIIIIHKIK